MYETQTTIVGRVATIPERTALADGSYRTYFRIVSTPRRRDDVAGWVDGDSMFLSVVCWRKLAEQVHASLSKGDPVIVHGRLRVNSWVDRDGNRVSGPEVDAVAVGPDLRSCTCVVRRTKSNSGADESNGAASGVGSATSLGSTSASVGGANGHGANGHGANGHGANGHGAGEHDADGQALDAAETSNDGSATWPDIDEQVEALSGTGRG